MDLEDALAEVAITYFREKEKRLRSHGKLIEASVTLHHKIKRGGETIYRFRAIFQYKRTRKPHFVWLDIHGHVIPDPSNNCITNKAHRNMG